MKGDVKDVEDALKGARDIIAEQVNEDERARNAVLRLFSLCNIRMVASGSNPFWRATSARVFRLGL